MTGAYYNEIDPYAAQWLRNLIAAGHIAAGDVDERDIRLVRADDLRGYTQCHFFAGIGVWSYALRLAGWPDDEPVWTGSCPCQPFSAAGRAGGFDDERHLWPTWAGLIVQHGARPVFGEQVASADGLAWLDFVCADMEGAGYSIGAVDTCAAGFGAPHIRQRLFFVADTGRWGVQRQRERGELHGEISQDGSETQPCAIQDAAGGRGEAGDLGDSAGRGRGERRHASQPRRGGHLDGADCSSGMGDAERGGRQGSIAWMGEGGRQACGEWSAQADGAARSGPVNGFWRNADWLPCRDGKARPVEPGTFPLAHGITNRVGRLRAYGNAINAEVAAEFIRAYRMTHPELCGDESL